MSVELFTSAFVFFVLLIIALWLNTKSGKKWKSLL